MKVPNSGEAGFWISICVKTLSILAITGVLLLLFESILRLSKAVPTRFVEFPDLETLDRIAGIFDPDQYLTDTSKPRLSYRVHINSEGLRGRDFQRDKPEGTFRILCLGDSFTFGVYVAEDKTYPAQLEGMLSHRCSNMKVEVVNAGAMAYTISDELEYFSEKGIHLDPDVVIVGFTMNDIADLTREISTREMQRINAARKSDRPLKPLWRFLDDIALFNLARTLRAHILIRTRASPDLQNVPLDIALSEAYDSKTIRLWNEYERYLLGMKQLTDDRGIHLAVLTFPLCLQMDASMTDNPQQYLRRICKKLHIPSMDLLPAFPVISG